MIEQPSVEKSTSPEKAAAPPAKAEKRSSGWGLWVLGGVILVALGFGAALVAAVVPRWHHTKELDAAAAQTANTPPTVAVAIARRAPETSDLDLPGNALPYREAALYARTTGYLKQWYKDIGDHVKEGELIAEISSPDVDDQLAQARANLDLAKSNLAVAEANLDLAKVTLNRDLASGTATAPEVVDQDKAQVKTSAAQVASAKSNIETNQATVQQFVDLVSFQKIIAAFPGVITARNVDPGALVTADNPSETRELFHLMQTDPLRVFINVPQVYSTTIYPGQTATLYRPEEPAKKFTAKVTRTANALDPNTRTLLTQIDVPNPKDVLRPGMYLRVNFHATRETPSVIIPSAALVTPTEGPEVALLDDADTVHYRKVTLGRDYGTVVEVIAGLEGGERVLVHPGDALPEGRKVQATPFGK